MFARSSPGPCSVSLGNLDLVRVPRWFPCHRILTVSPPLLFRHRLRLPPTSDTCMLSLTLMPGYEVFLSKFCGKFFLVLASCWHDVSKQFYQLCELLTKCGGFQSWMECLSWSVLEKCWQPAQVSEPLSKCGGKILLPLTEKPFFWLQNSTKCIQLVEHQSKPIQIKLRYIQFSVIDKTQRVLSWNPQIMTNWLPFGLTMQCDTKKGCSVVAF